MCKKIARVFRDVRESRETILLDILGLMRKKIVYSDGYVYAQQISFGFKMSYACIYDNLKLLEGKGFVRRVKRLDSMAKLAKPYILTIRGLLASLLSESYPPNDEELEALRRYDWGLRYIEPFKHVKSLLDLQAVVEMICNLGGRLEEISEDILMRIARNPHDVNVILDLLQHAKVLPLSFQAQEPGRYVVSIPSIPGSFAFSRIQKVLEGKEYVTLLINPTQETSEKLAEIIKDPNNEDYIGKLTAAFLESLVPTLSGGRDGVFIRYFNPETRQFVIAGSIPAEITQRLLYPEQILVYMQTTYQDMIEWLKDAEKKENRILFSFWAREYDPESRQIRSLSKAEIINKAEVMLEHLKKMRSDSSLS